MSSESSSKVFEPEESIEEILKEKTEVFVADDKITIMAWDVLTYLTRAVDNEEIDDLVCKYVRYTDMYPDSNDIRAADWIFVLHTLNFSLWSPKGTDPWTVDGYTGFSALCVAMKRAVNQKRPLWSPKYYKELYINYEDAEIIFRSDNETRIPLLNSRLELLRKVGTILEEQYEGTFAKCLQRYPNSKDLIAELAKDFPSYEKTILQYERVSETMEVTFCLKTFKLVTDVMCFFRKYEEFKTNPDFMLFMMFVDYRVFQIFLDYKSLYYVDNFKKKIEQNDTLEFESAEHLEVLACSKEIRRMLYDRLRFLISYKPTKHPEKLELFKKWEDFRYQILIDNFLWDYRHDYRNDHRLMNDMLFHNVISEYY